MRKNSIEKVWEQSRKSIPKSYGRKNHTLEEDVGRRGKKNRLKSKIRYRPTKGGESRRIRKRDDRISKAKIG